MGPKSTSGKKKTTTSSEDSKVVQEASPITLDKKGNILIKILAKPGAKQNSITHIKEEGVGVQINAPPVDGEANTELIKYLSKVLDLRKSDLSLDRGSKCRTKTVAIEKGAISIDAIKTKLSECCKNSES